MREAIYAPSTGTTNIATMFIVAASVLLHDSKNASYHKYFKYAANLCIYTVLHVIVFRIVHNYMGLS